MQLTFVASFVSIMSLWSVELIAAELEHPFGDDVNDLPVTEFHEEINKQLLMLLHAEARSTPGVTGQASLGVRSQPARLLCSMSFLDVVEHSACESDMPEVELSSIQFSNNDVICDQFAVIPVDHGDVDIEEVMPEIEENRVPHVSVHAAKKVMFQNEENQRLHMNVHTANEEFAGSTACTSKEEIGMALVKVAEQGICTQDLDPIPSGLLTSVNLLQAQCIDGDQEPEEVMSETEKNPLLHLNVHTAKEEFAGSTACTSKEEIGLDLVKVAEQGICTQDLDPIPSGLLDSVSLLQAQLQTADECIDCDQEPEFVTAAMCDQDSQVEHRPLSPGLCGFAWCPIRTTE